MVKSNIVRSGSVGIVGYLLGKFVEESFYIFGDVFKTYPGFPLNGSVSAATPILPDVDGPTKDMTKDEKRQVSEIMKYGFPSSDNVRLQDNYVLAYDNRTRVASWVFEHLTPDSVKKNNAGDRSKSEFVEDTSIHEYFRAKNSDYKRSGFDRGHLAAAANHRQSQKYMDQTFLLSNVAPQVGDGFNREAWMELEHHVRDLAVIYPNVYVCTGPLYLPKEKSKKRKLYVKYQVIGDTHVAVPTHFFKIVVMESEDRKLHMEAYVMPNEAIEDGTSLTKFMVPPEDIERCSGFLFFGKLSKKSLIKINGRKT